MLSNVSIWRIYIKSKNVHSVSGLFGTFQDFIQSFAVLQCGDVGNDCRLSLASRLGNVLILSLQSKGLKTKNLLKQAWQIFCFNPDEHQVALSWRRRESNPGPNKQSQGFLHA